MRRAAPSRRCKTAGTCRQRCRTPATSRPPTLSRCTLLPVSLARLGAISRGPDPHSTLVFCVCKAVLVPCACLVYRMRSSAFLRAAGVKLQRWSGAGAGADNHAGRAGGGAVPVPAVHDVLRRHQQHLHPLAVRLSGATSNNMRLCRFQSRYWPQGCVNLDLV